MNSENKKSVSKVPTKNYLIVGVIVLVVLLGSLYIYKWYDVYTENKIANSYLMTSKTLVHEIDDLSAIETVFGETVPNEYFVYVSYTKSKKIYELEKELKPIIDDYNLKDYIYYINVTNMMQESDYLAKLNDALGLTENKITEVPTMIYFKDGEVDASSIITREDDNIMQAGDFAKLLDIKGINKNH